MKLTSGGAPDVRQLVLEARVKPQVLLPVYRPPWAGHVLFAAAVVAAIAAGRIGGDRGALLGWAALAALMAGMVLQWRRRRPRGWRIDFDQRAIQSVDLPVVAPAVAADTTVRTVDRGAGARALELTTGGAAVELFALPPTTNRRETDAVRELADVLAARLSLQRAADID